MKKLITVAILGLSAIGAWAQGQVDFRNAGPTFATVADRKIYAAAVGNGLGLTGTNYVAGLWYVSGAGNGGQLVGTGGSQALNANTAHASVFSLRIPTTTSPGTWNPGANSFYFVLNGVGAGAGATLQVRVWDRSKYATFDDAFRAQEFGVSVPFDWTAPVAGDPPSKQFMEGLRAFAYVVVPEPSTIALGILGVASLLFLRRRK
jgi:hypothetical protein